MAIDIDQSYYNTGTASVTNGGTVVTGQGTQWTSSIRANDIFGTHKGDGVRILSIESNTSLTLAYPWTGETQTEAAYEVQFTPYDTGYYPAVRQLLQTMASGNIEAFAALTGSPDTIPMFTGPGALTLIPKADLINGVFYDVMVDTLADRAQYDDRPTGFAVLVADVGDGRSAIFTKNSLTSGDWSNPAYVTGPVGPLASINVGTTTTTAPGTNATVTNSGTPTAPVLDFGIPAGKGFYNKGDYSASATYTEGDVVQYNGSSWIARQTTTGNAPPSPPATSNANWQLLARVGDGGDMYKSVYDPSNQNKDIFAEIATRQQAGTNLEALRLAATPAANTLAYMTSATAAAFTPITAVARNLLDDTTTAAQRATIGTSRPAFRAVLADNRPIGNGNSDINLTNTTLNVGNSWNGSRFLVPETGIYLFLWSAQLSNGTNNQGYVIPKIKVNGSEVSTGVTSKTLFWLNVQVQYLARLVMGDTVTFGIELDGWAGDVSLQGVRTSAQGVLIG